MSSWEEMKIRFARIRQKATSRWLADAKAGKALFGLKPYLDEEWRREFYGSSE